MSTAFRGRPGWWLALPVCLLLHAHHVSAGEKPEKNPPADAEVTFSSGPGQVDARFVLRRDQLTLLAPFAEDGGAVGLFAVRLPKQDPLFAALAGVPARVAAPPPVPGMPTVRFVLRGPSDKGSERQLVVARPAADPGVDKALRELDRCERLARQHARMTLTLAVRPVQTAGEASSGACVATVSAQGEPHAQAVLSTSAIVIQAAPEPGPPRPGVTPLPLEWEAVSKPASPPSRPETLKPGGTLQVRLTHLTIDGQEPGPRQLRAVFDGSVELRVPGSTEQVKLSFSSKAAAVPGTPARAKK